jgi:hypothetical protein
MKSEEFDRAFGDGEMSRPSWRCRPPGGRAWSSGGVNVDFPEWMIESLDRKRGAWVSTASRSSKYGSPSA